jgi:hypothetical protein
MSLPGLEGRSLMRELTKSMFSFSWAMPLYGMKQMLNLTFPRDMSRPWGEATDAFNAVTGPMREQLGSTMRGMFDAGDQIQRGLVDAMFSLGLGAFDPNAWMRMGSDAMQRSTQGMQGGRGTGDMGSSAAGSGQGARNSGYGGSGPGSAGYSQGSTGSGCGSGGSGQGSMGYGSTVPGQATDYANRAADYAAGSMEQGARAVTETAYAAAAALGYQPSESGRSTTSGGGQSSGRGRSHRNR